MREAPIGRLSEPEMQVQKGDLAPDVHYSSMLFENLGEDVYREERKSERSRPNKMF